MNRAYLVGAHPDTGTMARVKFDPKSRETRFDRKVLWGEAKEAKAAMADRFDRIAEAGPGT